MRHTTDSSLVLAVVLIVAPCLLGTAMAAQDAHVNWETPHVHPLDLTPDGARLLAVNTPDGLLEVFDATGAVPVPVAAIPVGIDPVSVRARHATEAWVVNHISDSISIVDLVTGQVTATIPTDDEPADVIFAGAPPRAFVSCSQANTVLVFDPDDLAAAPIRLVIEGEEPRALATDRFCRTVYVGIFESGNGSTILGGGSTMGGGFPPNVVSDPAGPYGGTNPPPNDGGAFQPPVNGALPAAPAVGLIVKQVGGGPWMDDNGGDWTDLVSGAQAGLSGRPVGWNVVDHDIAVIDADSLSISYVDRLMNIVMAVAFNPADKQITAVGTDGTNEIRFEPNLRGTFTRVQLGLSDDTATSVVDLNPHLDYTQGTLLQSERDESLGDPRGIAWRAQGGVGYVTGMGSNNVIVIDATGARDGLAPTIEVGEGPTGIVIHENADRAYVLNKFDSSVSVIDLTLELQVAVVDFFDPEVPAVKVGRQHLYDTHKSSGLGQIACGSCHVDARMDRLAWDLGDPGGFMDPVAGQNLAAGLPQLAGTFEDFHPMKGPMLTQTLQDIIGKEPLHWRGDRDGIEAFNPAFIALQGDDTALTPTEMQEFEDFLATIHFPPNPFRAFDNTLPTSLPLDGHFTTGRFGPAGQPLGPGDAVEGLALYRPPNQLDAVACVTCHTLPTGLGADMTFSLTTFTYQPFPLGPNGERHHALVPVDGSTNVSIKTPHLRNLYERVGFNTTQSTNTAGFGFLHDGSVDSIERFISEPVFSVASDQDVADLTAFMLAFSGSDLPQGAINNILEPPGTASQDTHAAVGAQTTLEDIGTAPAAQLTRISDMLALADASAVGLIAKGRIGGEARGYRYLGVGLWQSDRAAQTHTTAALQALATPGGALTFTVVPAGSENRSGIDRDVDGHLDGDERDAASDPADAASVPGACGPAPTAPTGLVATTASGSLVALDWNDAGADESAFVVERALAGSGAFTEVARLPADTEHYTDIGLACATAYDFRVRARNCAGDSGFSAAAATTGSCDGPWTDLGASHPGTHGAPVCLGAGSLFPHTPMSVTLGNALESAPSFLIVGVATWNLPFYGGTMVPSLDPPGFFIPMTSDGTGAANLAASWPAGIPTGFTLYFQWWIEDAAASGGGFAGSNAVSATVP